MKAVISVIGHDRVGILAAVAEQCARYQVNIIDVSQTVMQNMFTMIMLVDIGGISVKFGDFAELMQQFGAEIGMDVRVMHEDIFNAMHTV